MNNGIVSLRIEKDGETFTMEMKQLNEHRCKHMLEETKVREYQEIGWIIAERGNVLIGIKCCPYCGLILDEEMREECVNIDKEEEIDWSKVEVDTEIVMPFYGTRHFSHYDNEENKIYFFPDGTTSVQKRKPIYACEIATEDIRLTE